MGSINLFDAINFEFVAAKLIINHLATGLFFLKLIDAFGGDTGIETGQGL